MSPGDSQILPEPLPPTAAKTWAGQGEISPKGTTEAGRKAEPAISNAVVDLAEKLLAGSAKPAREEVL
jgi:hypothetical protein